MVSLAVLAVFAVLAVRGITASRDQARDAEARAIERGDDLVFRQAADSLAADPTRAIAWLKQLRPDSRHRRGAALLAAEAIRRGVHRHVLSAQSFHTHRLELIDGDRRLFAVGEGRSTRVWDLDSGAARDLMRLDEPGYAGDGSFVGRGDDNRSLVIENIDAGEVTELPIGKLRIGDIVHDRGSRRIGIEVGPGFAVLDRAAGETRVYPRGFPLAFTDGGAAVVAFDLDTDTYLLWRAATETPAASLALPAAAVNPSSPADIAAPRGAGPIALKGFSRRGALLWTPGETEAHRVLDGETVTTMRYAPDGKTLALGTTGGAIAVIDPASRAVKCRHRPSSTATTAIDLAVAGSDRWLVAGSASGRVSIYRECGALERRLDGHLARITAVALSADGAIAASAGADSLVRVHDRIAEDRPPFVQAKRPIPAACDDVYGVYPRGEATWLLCQIGGEDSSDFQYVRVRGAAVDAVRFAEGTRVWFTADGSAAIAAAKSGGDRVEVWRDGERFERPIAVPASWSAEAGRVFALDRGVVSIWSLESGERLSALELGTTAAAPSPDGRWLAVDLGGGVGLVDLERDAAVVARSDTHLSDQGDSNVTWSADSSLVAFAVGERTLLVYDVAGDRWSRLSTRETISEMALSPVSRRAVATTANTRRLVVWDIDSGVTLTRSWGQPAAANVIAATDHEALSISADGTLATVHDTGATAALKLPEYSATLVSEATRTEIDDRGVARTPAP
jgi:WD40 repeat protein